MIYFQKESLKISFFIKDWASYQDVLAQAMLETGTYLGSLKLDKIKPQHFVSIQTEIDGIVAKSFINSGVTEIPTKTHKIELVFESI